MNSKQRAMLRGMANTMETILYIGKDGVVPGTIKQASDALEARELIKCAVQQGCPLTAREAVTELCAALPSTGTRMRMEHSVIMGGSGALSGGLIRGAVLED